MNHINIEIKARTKNKDKIRKILQNLNADFKGVDEQTDTYFNVLTGRLKLRQGKIENYLIYYKRENTKNPKQSDVILFKSEPNSSLKEILANALGVLVSVNKKREIYFIDNVKFHIDEVEKLGTFIEIEAIDTDGKIGIEKLLEQCNFYRELFQIKDTDLVAESYSDLLLYTFKKLENLIL